jgi:hypothetical protein
MDGTASKAESSSPAVVGRAREAASDGANTGKRGVPEAMWVIFSIDFNLD